MSTGIYDEVEQDEPRTLTGREKCLLRHVKALSKSLESLVELRNWVATGLPYSTLPLRVIELLDATKQIEGAAMAEQCDD